MIEMTDNSKTAFTFPGVGIELCGDEPALYNRYQSIYAPFLEKGSELADADLVSVLSSGSTDKPDEWKNQVFIYCFSVGTFHVLVENEVLPDITAGYSFGIYAALYAAGAVTFSVGFDILKKAFTAINETRPAKEISVSAVVGLSINDISNILKTGNFQSINRINTNNEHCHLLCGNQEEISPFQEMAIREDALNVVTLNITHPYHHPMFANNASKTLKIFLDTIEWNRPKVPFVSTINQQLLTSVDELKQFTADHLSTPINWYKTVELLYSNGFTQIIECGPGISLTQNARFIPGKAKWINTKNIKNRLGI